MTPVTYGYPKELAHLYAAGERLAADKDIQPESILSFQVERWPGSEYVLSAVLRTGERVPLT